VFYLFLLVSGSYRPFPNINRLSCLRM